MGPRASVVPRAPWMLDIISNPIHLVQMGKLRPREGKDVLEERSLGQKQRSKPGIFKTGHGGGGQSHVF